MVLQFSSPRKAIEEQTGIVTFGIEAERLFPKNPAATIVLKRMGFIPNDLMIELPKQGAEAKIVLGAIRGAAESCGRKLVSSNGRPPFVVTAAAAQALT